MRPGFYRIFSGIVIGGYIILMALPGAVHATAAPQIVNFQVADSRVQQGTSEARTNQLIIKYKPQADQSGKNAPAGDQRIQALNSAAGVPLEYVRAMSGDAHVMRLPERLPAVQVEAMARKFAALPDVEYAEPDLIMFPVLTPNDPQFASQWHYFEAHGINASAAWDITTGSNSIRIAVIDTGITNHADLAGRWVGGYDFISDASIANDGNARDSDPHDPGDWITSAESASGFFAGCPVSNSSWHGTHVAGTIGAASNNGIGVAGINWNSQIVPVRVLGKCGGFTSDIVDGMRWAAGLSVSGVPANPNPAKVLNLSLGGSGACSATYQNAINAINTAGSIVVVAAGNSNLNANGFQPANCSGVITVASTDRGGDKAYYSNFGTVVEISAPGGETVPFGQNGILSTLNTGTTSPAADTYAFYQGTSMAAPHVTGVVSLMVSLDPTLDWTQVVQVLQSTARAFPAGSGCTTSTCGSGIVDAASALNALSGPLPTATHTPTLVPVSNDDFNNAINVSMPYSNTQSIDNATTATDDPVFTCSAGQRFKSVWYRHTPLSNGTLTVGTAGSNYDTVLAVWTGTRGTLASQGCNDDFGGGLQSQVQLSVSAGLTYYIEVASWSDITSGSLNISMSFAGSNTPTATNTASATPTHTPTNTPAATNTGTPVTGNNALYLSLTANGTVGGVASADEDILFFSGTTWSLFFDGSDVGVGSLDLFAFSIVDADTLLMSFNNAITLGGLAIAPQDVVRFDATSLGSNTAGTFSMYFDGSDVGLDTTAEKIDAVSPRGDGRVLLSTTGNPAVPGLSGGRDEDVLAFTPTSLGSVTSGSWAIYLDGSDVGLGETSGEDVDAMDISGGTVYLSTLDAFSVSGVSGADEDVFVCTATVLGDTTACTYSSSLYFDGSVWGLAANDVDAIHVLSTGPGPTNTPTSTPGGPTNTPTRTPTATNPAGPSATPTRTPTPSLAPSPTATSSGADLIFADSFESGNLSAWDANSNDAGDLSANPAAALVGSQGLQAVIDDATAIYLTDNTPNLEPRYRARFYFDPNSITMTSGDQHFIFKAMSGTTEVIRLEFRFSGGLYQVRGRMLNDSGVWLDTAWFNLTDDPNSIEMDWRAASAAGANDGGLTLWINGVEQVGLTGIDNDTRRIDRARLGALSGMDAGTSGTYYFDAFESRRQNYIGP